MTTTPEDRDPSQDPDAPTDPFAAARRYGRPGSRHPDQNSSGMPMESVGRAGPTPPSSEVDSAAPQSKTPMILGVVGIIGWFLCGVGAIGSVVAGAIGQRKAREFGQPDLLPKIAWIGGIVVLVGNLIVAAYTLNHS
ncbi:MAG: hypothetical protein ACREMY_05195 [bacterium]